jgi:hypothetical protein
MEQEASSDMAWRVSFRADQSARVIADRHYNRQSIGAAQFVPPGRCLVLLASDNGALWVTSWPFSEYVKHEWAGAWVNSLFRRETTPMLSSVLISQAVSATRFHWGEPPAIGMITFVDSAKVRKKRDVGRCYRKAGFSHVGYTKGGLYAFQLLPAAMPEPRPAAGTQLQLIA